MKSTITPGPDMPSAFRRNLSYDYIVVVCGPDFKCSETGKIVFPGVVVHSGTAVRYRLGLYQEEFLAENFVPWHGTVTLEG